uniref:CTLH domain-containing protein n=2 Tax=Kalanchoe fedtschenkoi TaxID=63787 RepID=A0A7N0VHZ4_KALFE
MFCLPLYMTKMTIPLLWQTRRRLDIAGMMSSILRANLLAYDPVFSLTLRYLISIHKGFCISQRKMSPISDLSERLFLEQWDPSATPSECFLEAPLFDEVDIQSLAHAVELTRQGAVDSLKFAKGDLLRAFQNELCRMRLDISMLDELVLEYCVYRGIVDNNFASPGLESLPKTVVVNRPDGVSCSSENCLMDVEPEECEKSDDSTFVNCRSVDGKQNANGSSPLSTDMELRCSFDSTNSQDDCSISGTNPRVNLKIGHKNRISIAEDKSRRKRWRGRQDFEDLISDPMSSGNRKPCRANSGISGKSKGSEKYEIVLRVKELVSNGLTSEVVEEINTVDPDFFVQNPSLLFQLKQVEFLKLVRSGDHSGSLRVACSYLGPLASSNPALLKPLKETLLALLMPNEVALEKGSPLNALATTLQVALGRRFGIEEPQLMKIMKAALHTHTEWFKLQMCKDRFEEFLQIDCLKDADTSFLTDTSKSNIDSGSRDSSQLTFSSGSKLAEEGNSPQMSSRDFVYDENAILKVMEFLALPRAEAIHLLVEYNGNADAAIQQIFM